MSRFAALAVAGATCANVARAEEAAPANIESSAVVVQGIRPPRDTWDTQWTRDEAASVAGTDDDPAKIVQDLPGVAHASLGQDPLILWGSSQSDTRVLVDGVEIPALFHGGALRSTVDGELIGAIALTPGAYGAGYGRAIGGLVRIETRELPREGVHGALDVNLLDAGAATSAALGDRVRLALVGLYGYLDRTLPAAGIAHDDRVFPIPSYGDYFAKIQVDLRERESLDALVLGSRDSLTTTASTSDPAHALASTAENGFDRVALRYRRTLGDGARVEVTPWIGRDASTLDAHFGANPERLDEHDLRWGVRADERARFAANAVLALGLDATGTHATLARQGSLALPAREGDVTVFGESPGNDVESDAWHASIVDVAPYASVDWKLGVVNVEPALRADGYLVEASRKTPRAGETPSIGASSLQVNVEPRLSMRVDVTKRVRVLAAAGLYSEPPAPSDLSAVFGTPTLGPATAEHASLGESIDLSRTLSATVTAFYKWMGHLPVRDPSPTPALTHVLDDDGVGRSYGVQFLLRQKPWHGFSGWLAYTLSRSERRDAPGAAFRLFDEDEPDVLTLAANQLLGAYTVGARFRYASGQPRTPVQGALFDEKDDVFQPVFGAQNSLRLPAFWQLDLRVDRRFAFHDGTTLSIYVEALNVTDHANADDFVYSTDYSRRGAISGLPVLGVAGARITQ